uniref:Uncharacterized protein n=1 Tax=Bicosoecida sp. CB-2014 TaxID=1486930 RepID=A0A7S1GG10_9STRA
MAAEEILAEAAVAQRRELVDVRAELTAHYEALLDEERSKPKIATSEDVEAGMARLLEAEAEMKAKAAKIERMAAFLDDKERSLRGVQDVLKSAQADIAADAARQREAIEAARARAREEMAAERSAHEAELQDLRALLKEEAAKARQLISASLHRPLNSPPERAAAGWRGGGAAGGSGSGGRRSGGSGGGGRGLRSPRDAEEDKSEVAFGGAAHSPRPLSVVSETADERDERHAALVRPLAATLSKDDVAAFTRALSQAMTSSPLPATLAELDGGLRERAAAVDRVVAAESMADGSIVMSADPTSPASSFPLGGPHTHTPRFAGNGGVGVGGGAGGGLFDDADAVKKRQRDSVRAWEDRMRNAWRHADAIGSVGDRSDLGSVASRRVSGGGGAAAAFGDDERSSWLTGSSATTPAAGRRNGSRGFRGFRVGDAVGVYVPGKIGAGSQAHAPPSADGAGGGAAAAAANGDVAALQQRFLPCRVIEAIDFTTYRLRTQSAVLSKPVKASLMVPLDDGVVPFDAEVPAGMPVRALSRVAKTWRESLAVAL